MTKVEAYKTIKNKLYQIEKFERFASHAMAELGSSLKQAYDERERLNKLKDELDQGIYDDKSFKN